MDGFAEANLLLNSALEQLDSLIINGQSNMLLPCLLVTTPVSLPTPSLLISFMSDASSEVESPPSDVPTTSSSPCYTPKPKVYCDFLKAIEDHSITERPSRETQLKIMQWLTGSCVSVVSYRFCVRSLNHNLFCAPSINKMVVFLCRHRFPSDSIF
uniref:Uncharacterized protein n=1 Tax=Angiostrongylus cantonensis TaxID=6313 RepID=A0A0K0CYR0_ANGCA